MSLISRSYAQYEKTRGLVKSLEHKHGVVFTFSWLDTTHATISRSCCLLRGHKLLHQSDHSRLRDCLIDIRQL